MGKVKKLFNKLQIDSKSVLFNQEQLNDKLLKKLKNSKYEKDKEFVNRFNLLEDKKKLISTIIKRTSTQFQLKLNTFKKAMILIALLDIVFMHSLIFCSLMLVICVF